MNCDDLMTGFSPSERLEQMELDLWHVCDVGYQFPMTADIAHIQQVCETMVEVTEPLPLAEQLAIVGEVFLRLSATLLNRTNQIVGVWEQRHHPAEPMWSDDLDSFMDSVTIKTTSVDTNEFVLSPEYAPYPEQRKSSTLISHAAGELLSEWIQEANHEGNDQLEATAFTAEDVSDQVQKLAHEEDVVLWSTLVESHLQACFVDRGLDTVSFVDLVAATGLSIIKVWLVLMLGKSEYCLVQFSEDFYSMSGLQIRVRETV